MPPLRRQRLRLQRQRGTTGPSRGSLVQFTLSHPRQHDRQRKEQQPPGHESAGAIVQKRDETGIVPGIGGADDVSSEQDRVEDTGERAAGDHSSDTSRVLRTETLMHKR